MTKTFANHFHRVDRNGSSLFEVRAGLSTNDAMEAASSLMESALSILSTVAGNSDDYAAWGAYVLFEAAKATVDACIAAPGASHETGEG